MWCSPIALCLKLLVSTRLGTGGSHCQWVFQTADIASAFTSWDSEVRAHPSARMRQAISPIYASQFNPNLIWFGLVWPFFLQATAPSLKMFFPHDEQSAAFTGDLNNAEDSPGDAFEKHCTRPSAFTMSFWPRALLFDRPCRRSSPLWKHIGTPW